MRKPTNQDSSLLSFLSSLLLLGRNLFLIIPFQTWEIIGGDMGGPQRRKAGNETETFPISLAISYPMSSPALPRL